MTLHYADLNITFSIIIVTWNGLHHLKKFLPSVTESEYDHFEVIIADNASDDGTVEWVQKNYPNCKTVTFDQNYGYAGGNNRAVKYADGDVLIFLNNDVETASDWLQHLDNAFREQNADILQPKIKSLKEKEYFEYAGAAGGYIDWLGYPFCRGRIFQHVEKDESQYDIPAEIFWASGAALAVKKDLFLSAGGFDEAFEFHMEEIDLCWRCHKQGATIMVEPKSVVYHLGGGSLDKSDPRKAFYNYRNSLLMLTKNLDTFLFPKIFFRLILDGISGIRSLVSGKPMETFAIIKSHFSFYSMLAGALEKRKILTEKSIHPSPIHLIHQRLIISETFLRGKKKYSDLADS